MTNFVKGFACVLIAGIAIVLPASRACAVDLGDKVVSQGGVTVTVSDVDAYMARIPAEKWAGFVSSAERIEKMLRDILRNKMLAAQAVDMKLDQSASAQAQITQARTDVLARLRMQSFAESIKVPDLTQLAKEEYLTHKDQYVIPENVVVEHILVSNSARSDAEAKALAEKIRAEAEADPAKFEDMVKKYSDDPSKDSNGGVMRDASSAKYVPEFAKAAGKLTAQDPISPLVKTKFGYHILKLISATPAKPQTFDEVKAQILDGLGKQYSADQTSNFLGQLTGQEMTPYPDAIAALHGRYYTGTGVPVENPQPQPQPQPIPPAQNAPATGEH